MFGKLESKEIDENSIVSECAYVGSQTHIYNDTLRNNLTLWNEAITDTQIKKVLERVNLLSFLNRIDEQVSDGSFSEGQKTKNRPDKSIFKRMFCCEFLMKLLQILTIIMLLVLSTYY